MSLSTILDSTWCLKSIKPTMRRINFLKSKISFYILDTLYYFNSMNMLVPFVSSLSWFFVDFWKKLLLILSFDFILKKNLVVSIIYYILIFEKITFGFGLAFFYNYKRKHQKIFDIAVLIEEEEVSSLSDNNS